MSVSIRTLEARGVISTVISFPSSSVRGLYTALVCRRAGDDAKARRPGSICGFEHAGLLKPWCRALEGAPGTRNSRRGAEVWWKDLLGAICKNARAADAGCEVAHDWQPRVRGRAVMVYMAEGLVGADRSRREFVNARAGTKSISTRISNACVQVHGFHCEGMISCDFDCHFHFQIGFHFPSFNLQCLFLFRRIMIMPNSFTCCLLERCLQFRRHHTGDRDPRRRRERALKTAG